MLSVFWNVLCKFSNTERRLVPGLSAAVRGYSGDLSEVWIWGRVPLQVLVQLAGAQLTAWNHSLKSFICPHPPIFFFLPHFSLISFICVWRSLSLRKLKWLNYFRIWAWTVDLCCFLREETEESWLILLSCWEHINSECFVWNLGLHLQLCRALKVLWGWCLGGISWCWVWALRGWGGQWVIGGGLSSRLAGACCHSDNSDPAIEPFISSVFMVFSQVKSFARPCCRCAREGARQCLWKAQHCLIGSKPKEKRKVS